MARWLPSKMQLQGHGLEKDLWLLHIFIYRGFVINLLRSVDPTTFDRIVVIAIAIPAAKTLPIAAKI